ncbi:glycoside hydrolase family 43 protein [Echinicola shivajiensis]|uniref:glycoside hydrolase family 43 protein n=1 Tax=Echinicola shivajiensis TaxID=1035916 RepID=UPI001BFC6CE2|nr:glycoside hydrolase family 43 protein [Echinicola shivajiensis]
MKFNILISLTATTLALLSTCQQKNQQTELVENKKNENVHDTFNNPILKSGPDPWTIYSEGYYYYIRSGNREITLMRTPDITDLANAEKEVVWQAPNEGMYSQNIWAPEIHRIDNKWYIYVAADDGDNNNHRMYALENTSKDPFEGEFIMKGKITTDANDNWAIDGSVFEHKGQLYFIWSGWADKKVDTETQRIYIASMSNPWTIDSDRIMISEPEFEWERNWEYEDTWVPDAPIYVNEGPQMLKYGNKLHIIYSASGCWTPYYALGCLTTSIDKDLLNPSSWEKSQEPIFQQSQENGVYGTGHNCFFKSPDGTEDWILYHATDSPDGGCSPKRSPRAQKISWTHDDMPILGKPVSTSEQLEKPSGTP